MALLVPDQYDISWGANPSLDLRRAVTHVVPSWQQSAGPRSADPRDQWAGGNPPVRRRVVLFIHGYNASNTSAKDSFASLQEHLAQWSTEAADDVVWVFWPGDARSKIPLAEPLIFPQSVGKAIELGPRFADVIRDFRGPGNTPCEVVLVGHSLGCRLILEALDALRHGPPCHNTVSLVFLMAAAVPVSHAVGRFAAALTGATRVAKRVVVLHSDEDVVLQVAFRLGHMLGPDRQFLAQAVGLHGNPRLTWDDHAQMLHFDHGSYWHADLQTGEDAPVARRLATELAPPRERDALLELERRRAARWQLFARVLQSRHAERPREMPARTLGR